MTAQGEEDFFGVKELCEIKSKESEETREGHHAKKIDLKENVHSTPFGQIRYDSENLRNTVSGIERKNPEPHHRETETDSSGSDFLDEQYFGSSGQLERNNLKENGAVDSDPSEQSERNHIHEQYFDRRQKSFNGRGIETSEERIASNLGKVGPFPAVSWKRLEVDDRNNETVTGRPAFTSEPSVNEGDRSDPERYKPRIRPDNRSNSVGVGSIRLKKKESMSMARPAVVAKVVRTVSAHTSKAELDPDSGLIEDSEGDSSVPVSAFDVVKNIRNEERAKQLAELQKNKDFDGSLVALFHLWSQIPDLNNFSKFEIVEILKNRILYQEHDLLFLNKPYGIVAQDGASTKHTVSSLLPQLCKLMYPDSWQEKKLYLCQRLDKETTGAMMLATSYERKEEIASLMAQHKIIKKYLCITKGVPSPNHGIIKIPLGQRIVGSRYKMVPVTESSSVDRRFFRKDNRLRQEAETVYRVLSEGPKCALVECTMKTGVTHQIRSHLGFGLDTPVIGDHKYSNFLSFKPQRLPSEVLQCMGIRSSKSRDLPMYLHAREIMIPEYINGRNIFFRAPIPKFFQYTMKKLKLAL